MTWAGGRSLPPHYPKVEKSGSEESEWRREKRDNEK